MCLKGGKKTYCGPLWYRAWAIPKNRSFWNRYIFHDEIGENMIFNAFEKNPLPPLPPNSWWLLWRYMIKNNKISKIWRAVFCFRAEIAFLRPKTSNYCNCKKCQRMAHFLHWFECVGINYDKKGLPLHDGALKWQNMLTFWPKTWISEVQNNNNVNLNLIPSKIMIVIVFLLVLFCFECHL